MFRGMQTLTVIHWKTFVVSCQSCIAKTSLVWPDRYFFMGRLSLAV